MKNAFPQRKTPWDWFRSRLPWVTASDLEATERRIIMKISELGGNIDAIKGQVVKVSKEQQDRFDKLSAKIDELEGQLNDQDVPAEVTSKMDEVKSLLQQLDDTIIDTDGGDTGGGTPPNPLATSSPTHGTPVKPTPR